MGHASDTVTCSLCRQVKTVALMRRSTRIKRGHYPYCTDCDNARRRAQRRAKPKPDRKELRRKLPPWATLKRLYEEGMSFSDIAEKYDVNRSAVYHTMRRRAARHGDPWPLVSRVSATTKMKRTLALDTVNPALIISLVWDHIAEEAKTVEAWMLWEQEVHREATGHGFRDQRSAFNIALRAFCRRNQLSRGYLFEIHSGRYKRVSRDYARKLLTLIGEPYHPDLERRRPKKYAGHTRKAA